MPKPVEQMTVEEITKEISYIEQQIRAGKVGTPNVYVRLQTLKAVTELVGRGFRGVLLTADEIREAFEEKLERTATDEELTAFIDYLEIDHGQWLNDNAKTFIRDKLPLPAKTATEEKIQREAANFISDRLSRGEKSEEPGVSRPFKAHEVLIQLCGMERCPECKSPVSDDWQYKDFSNKNIVICPQCKTEYNVEELQERVKAREAKR